MKVALAWLQEFIDLPTTDVAELSYVFDMLGHTVENVVTHEAGWSDVYVGKVLDIAAHPDADKVRVCQVDSGTGPTQIICGAWNFETGASVAVARPGAVLPGDFDYLRFLLLLSGPSAAQVAALMKRQEEERDEGEQQVDDLTDVVIGDAAFFHAGHNGGEVVVTDH